MAYPMAYGNDGRPMGMPPYRSTHRAERGRQSPARRRGGGGYYGDSFSTGRQRAAADRLAKPKAKVDPDLYYEDQRAHHPKAWGAGGAGRKERGWQPGRWRQAHDEPSHRGRSPPSYAAPLRRERAQHVSSRAAPARRQRNRKFPPLERVHGMSQLDALREQQRAQQEQLYELRERHHQQQREIAEAQQAEIEELHEMQAWQQTLTEDLANLEEQTMRTAQQILDEIEDARADVRSVSVDRLADLHSGRRLPKIGSRDQPSGPSPERERGQSSTGGKTRPSPVSFCA